MLFVASATTATLVPTETGSNGAHQFPWADIVAGINIVFGTLIAFAQIPNRESKFVDDGDLTALSVAFLAAGALLPLAQSFRGHSYVTWGTAALVLIFIAGYLAWARWYRRSARRAVLSVGTAAGRTSESSQADHTGALPGKDAAATATATATASPPGSSAR